MSHEEEIKISGKEHSHINMLTDEIFYMLGENEEAKELFIEGLTED